jgi:cytochrome c5
VIQHVSRATQGGCGFASDDFDPGQCFAKGNTTTANPAIYDHGITQGASEALDAQTLWIFAAVRPLQQPQPSDVGPGREVFEANCASCHGGAKWTKSEIFHRDNPAAVAQNGAALDPGVDRMLNGFKLFTCNDLSISYLEDVFPLHTLPAAGGKTIADALTALEQSDLLDFLKSIDGTTAHFRSGGDVFRDALRMAGPCPPPPPVAMP